MYLTLIILPLLASIISGFLGRKIGIYGSQIITCVSIFFTAILAVIIFFEVGFNNISVSIKLFRWIDSEYINISWGFNFDSLTVSMLLPVLIVSLLVHIYSIGYMSNDPHIQRFFSYLSLFTFMMIILVTADNMLVMFVGWEGVGVCSYLLVNFWFTRIAANQSSISAFLTNRVGDCFLTIGMFIILWCFGNIDYYIIFSITPYVNEHILTITGICILIGAMAKSSQVGLHVWLPMAMEGPTPVSALIHAATMVTAGVYLLIRLSPLIEYSNTVLLLSLWLGAITAIFSSLIGLFQQDIKKVIAYSTMSQLGMMVIAVGLSCYNIALFHLINHAFYKGLLFLAAGSVIHAVADNQDFRKYGGLLIFLPLTYSVILIGSLSLVAFPFMTGFYSKDFILESAYGQFFFSSIIIYYIAIIAALFTTLYSVKVLYLTFLTNPNGSLIDYKKAHEGDIFMSLPLIILAIFSIFFGFITKDIFIGLGTGFFMDNGLFIHPDHGTIIETEFAVPTFYKLLPLFTTLLFTLIAIFISELYPNILIYIKFSKIGYNMFGFFNQRFLIELLYNKYIINILFLFGGHTTKIIDKGSIEYIGPYGLEYSLIYVSNNISKLDSGIITSYALYILSGLMFYIFIAYIYYFDNIIIIILLLITLFVNSFIELSKPLCNFDIYYQNRNININMASIFHRNRYFNLENFSFIFHLVLLLYLLFPLCKLPIYDVIDSMTVFDEEFKLDYKHLDFDFIDDDPSKGVCFMENNNPESSGSNTEDNSNLANSDQNTENSSNLANTDQNTENSFNNVDQNAENSPNNVDQNNGVENTQPIDNSAAADLNSSLPTVQFNNPWDHSRIADCEHRDRNTHGFAQDLGDQPIPCDICTHNATTNPGDYASFCNSCGAIICHDCDLIVSGEGPSPIDTDSGFEDED